MTSNAVSVLPPTGGIKDSATREFLDALTNMLDARSGYTNKDAPERFITAAEFQGLTNRALIQAFSSGGISPGSPGGGIPSAKEINDAIDNLADFIRKSLIYQKLGEQIDLIDISALRQRVQELGTGIYHEEVVRKDADLQLASSITTLQAGLDNSSAAIQQELETRAARDLALAKAINTIWAAVGGSQAVIQDGALASATPNSAQATKWDQVVASVTDPNTGLVNSTSIKQELNTYASNADGKFNSIYSVRAQVSTGGQTVVGGFGLSATAGASSGEGPTIDFGVRADKFFIAATSATPDAQTQINQGSSTPFMVLTSNQWVNGVVYGPGVYIKKAVIGEATIGSAQIADLAVTNAKVGNVIQSNNYSPGLAGWRIQKSGDAEFNGIVLSRPNIVRSGVFDANLTTTTQILVGSDGKGSNIYRLITKNDVVSEFIIDTGYNVYEDVGAINGPAFVARVRGVSGGSHYAWWSGGRPLDPWYDLYPEVSVGFYGTWGTNGGVWTGEYGRVFIRVRVSVELFRRNITQIRFGNFRWELARLT